MDGCGVGVMSEDVEEKKSRSQRKGFCRPLRSESMVLNGGRACAIDQTSNCNREWPILAVRWMDPHQMIRSWEDLTGTLFDAGE